MRSKRRGRSVEGGARSTPITSNSASCGSRRVPRFPETPVITTVGFGSPILFGTGCVRLCRRRRLPFRRGFREIFLVQFGRGGLLDGLHRILDTLRPQG